MWSIYGYLAAELYLGTIYDKMRRRSNDYTECFHATHYRTINRSHPNFFEILTKLMEIQMSFSLNNWDL